MASSVLRTRFTMLRVVGKWAQMTSSPSSSDRLCGLSHVTQARCLVLHHGRSDCSWAR